MDRRRFLKIAGSAGVIVAASGTTFALTRSPTDALKPWQQIAETYPDPVRRALSYAILAPNPHNRQPWIVELLGDAEAVLTCDLERLLPETDPYNRQIVIGLGCFLETFSIAAGAQGFQANIQVFPDGWSKTMLDERPIARLSMSKQPGLEPDPLFGEILKRRTNRSAYDQEKSISPATLERLHEVNTARIDVGTAGSGDLLEDLKILTRDASFREAKTPETHQESVDLMRIGRSEIEANPDGISLDGPMLEILNRLGLLTRAGLTDPASSAFQTGLDMVEEWAMSSMGFVWINTDGNDRPDQIAAGRAYMRIALKATAEGLAMQPMSQALQEYASMAPYYDHLHELLTRKSGETVQMLARLGYAEPVGPAPRWPLSTRLKRVDA